MDNVDLTSIQNKNQNTDDFIKTPEKTPSKTKAKAEKKTKKSNDLPNDLPNNLPNNLLNNDLLNNEIPELEKFEKIEKLPTDFIKMLNKKEFKHDNKKDEILKNKFIDAINDYKDVFHKFIKTDLSNLNNCSVEQLDNILKNVKKEVHNRNSPSMINLITTSIPYGIEKGARFFDIDLTNYGTIVSQNPEYYYLIQEILLEYNIKNLIDVDARIKLAYLLLSSAYLINHINKNNINLMNDKLNQNIDGDKYKDI